MSQAIIAKDRDADLIQSNVKAGVTIDDTLGTYSGGFSSNIVPIHYVGQCSVAAPTISNQSTDGGCTQYGGFMRIWGVVSTYSPPPSGESQVYMFKINLNTFEIDEYIIQVFTSGTATFKLTGTLVECNINSGSGYNTSFDIDGGTAWSSRASGNVTHPGTTNSETAGGLTYKAKSYWETSLNYKSGFYIS